MCLWYHRKCAHKYTLECHFVKAQKLISALWLLRYLVAINTTNVGGTHSTLHQHTDNKMYAIRGWRRRSTWSRSRRYLHVNQTWRQIIINKRPHTHKQWCDLRIFKEGVGCKWCVCACVPVFVLLRLCSCCLSCSCPWHWFCLPLIWWLNWFAVAAASEAATPAGFANECLIAKSNSWNPL